MWLHTWHPESVLVTIGPLTIHWYGVCFALGAAAAWWLIRSLARGSSVPVEHLDRLLPWLILGGLLGARLYHVANEWGYYRLHADRIFQVWQGGLAIHGALLAGAVIIWAYARTQRVSFLKLTDHLVPGLVLAQAIGRWGNYFNQELFGRATSLPWGIPIEAVHRPAAAANQTYFHPTFLYESLGNLAILGILLWIHRRQRPASAARSGYVTLAYFLLYGILRMVTESFRIDRTPVIAGVRLPILVSGLIVMAAVIGLILLIRSRHAQPR